jgi:hypothetical protein
LAHGIAQPVPLLLQVYGAQGVLDPCVRHAPAPSQVPAATVPFVQVEQDVVFPYSRQAPDPLLQAPVLPQVPGL